MVGSMTWRCFWKHDEKTKEEDAEEESVSSSSRARNNLAKNRHYELVQRSSDDKEEEEESTTIIGEEGMNVDGNEFHEKDEENFSTLADHIDNCQNGSSIR